MQMMYCKYKRDVLKNSQREQVLRAANRLSKMPEKIKNLIIKRFDNDLIIDVLGGK